MPKITRYRVIANVSPRPTTAERTAAELVANFLHTDIEFIQSGTKKSPDLLIANQMWEIKSPKGNASYTILHQFQRASAQAHYLIFDARRIKMSGEKCLKRVQREFAMSRKIKRVIYIDKQGSVFELHK